MQRGQSARVQRGSRVAFVSKRGSFNVGSNHRIWMASSAACALMLSGIAGAQVVYSTAGSSYTQNFDTLPNSPTNTSLQSTAKWTDDNASPPAGSSSILGWYLYHPLDPTGGEDGTNGHQRLRAGSGSSTTGAFYSFGANGSTQRALGDVGATTLANDNSNMFYGLRLVNTTSQTLTNFTLSYTGEEWRNGGSGTTDKITFGYSTGVTSASWTTGAYTSVPGLEFDSPVNSMTAATLDGTAVGNKTAEMASVSGVNWAPGTELWLRFSSLQIAGNDDGLGIDDLSFSAISTVPSLLWNNAAGTKKWNTTDANFTDGTNNALYVDSDLVTFGDTAVGSVNVDSGGVTPGSVNVTNTTGEYTFTGGSILGATALTKSNAGTLTLTASNGYTGGTTITGGMLNFSNDNQLGAASGSVTVSGGTLHATSNVTSARAISASAGTIQVDGGSTFSASGVFSDASGLFTKAGAGTFAVTGQWSVGTTSMISIPAGTVLIQPSTGSVNLSADNVGNNYVGDVLIDLTNDTGTGSSTRINFGNNEIISGGGKIKLLSSGVSLDTVGTANIVANIGNEIVLNPNNNPGAFTINLGAVGGQTLETTVISGNGAVNLATSAGSGGSGALLLNGTMTYTGGTTVNTGVAAGLGVVRLNVSDAFPTAGSITFNTATGAYAGPAPIDLNGHNQTITGLSVGAGGGTLPSILTNDLASTTSVLTINAVGSTTYSGQINDGTVSGAVMSLAKTGTGTFVFSGSGGYTGTTTVNSTGGALVLKGSTAWGPALNSAGQTDIKSGKLVFDYSTDSDPTIAVRSALATAAASSFATGQIHSSTAQVMAHPRSLGYIDDTTNQKLTVAYTLAGDANLDGTVNGLDFNALANGYGTSPASNTWTQGDYDYSGAVDSGDFALLAENYGQTIGGLNAALPDAALPASGLPASALGSVVPEPASVGMLLTCGLGLIKRRRRA